MESEPASPRMRRVWHLAATLALASLTACTGSDVTGTAPELVWTRTTLPGATQATRLWDVWGSGPDDVYAVGHGGMLAHYDGRQWTRVPVDTAFVLYGVHGTSASDVWVVGTAAFGAGEGVTLHFDGSRWTTTRLAGMPLFRVRALAPTDVVGVLTAGQGVVRFDGTRWVRIALNEPGMNAVWAESANAVWVTGEQGRTYRNEGAWTQRLAATDGLTLFAIWGRSVRDVWVGGSRGQLLHDDGSGWRRDSLFTTQTITGMWGATFDDIWAVTTSSFAGSGSGFLARYSGGQWRLQPQPVPNLFGVWGASARDVWAVGDEGAVLRGVLAR